MVDPQSFGKVQAEVESLKKDMDELKNDIKAIRSLLDSAGGSWKALMIASSFLAAVSGAVGWVLSFIFHK